MKLHVFLFALLIFAGVVSAALWRTDATPRELGFDHPNFPAGTMQQAPDGYERHRSVIAAAAVYGVLITLFAGSAIVLGLKPAARAGRPGRLLIVLAGVYAMLIALVAAAYWANVLGGEKFILGFPLSTAVMLFCFAPAPVVGIVLYAVCFPQWIISPAEERTFRDLVARRRRRSVE